MNFASPWALWLVVPVLAAAVVAWRRRPPALPLPQTTHLGRDPRTEALRRMPLVLEAAGCLSLVFATARPQRVEHVVRQEPEAADIMLVLDVSGSMAAVDVDADNATSQAATLPTRLAYARDEIRRLMAARPADRFGLVVFARRPYPACPLTVDHGLLESRLQALTADLLADGTGLTAAIALGAIPLRASPSPRRALILLTDGRSNVPSEPPPQVAAALAAQNGVNVHVIGIGSDRAVLPVPGLAGLQYRAVETPIDEERLRAIAEAGGGTYVRATDASHLAPALARVDAMERGRAVPAVQRSVRELFPAFAVAAVALLSLAFGLSRTVARVLP